MATFQSALFINLILLMGVLSLQVAARTLSHGLRFALSSLDRPAETTVFECRLVRVARNQVEFIVLLTPLVFAVGMQSHPIEHSTLLAQAFIIGRALYVAAALLGIPYLRSLFWLVGFSAWAVMLFQILT